MRSFWKVEFHRLITNKAFWGMLLCGLIISICQFVDVTISSVKYLDVIINKLSFMNMGTLYPHSVYNHWIGGELESYWHFIYFLLIPVMAVVPYSYTYNSDRQTKLTVNYYTRGLRRDYTSVKYIITFLTGGFTVMFPLVVNLLLTMMKLPLLTPQAASGMYPINGSAMFADMYYTSPGIYTVLFLVIIFIYAGLMAITPLSLSLFTDNGFVQMAMPFVGNIFIYCVCNITSLYRYVPLRFTDPAQNGGFTHAPTAFIELGIIFVLNVCAMYRGMKDETL